ncbi:MAG: HD domain-containing protein [Clostridia bacterium]|nr:HD domain-containing protein [Clostridia bacterium]
MTVDFEKLKELAKLFAPYAPLYMVGGVVRDELLGCSGGDVDICSPLTVDEVKRVLTGVPTNAPVCGVNSSQYTVLDRNLRMGTVHIVSHGFCAEYTTFRTDSYDRASGAHTPTDVRFTTDISEDARRRDFKCNAVYKDIMTGEIVDPLSGVDDIKRGILVAADTPDNVFEADGLRILRLVRFACELGFEIEQDTMRAAKQNAWRVKDIAVERVREELNKIFISDCNYKGKLTQKQSECGATDTERECNASAECSHNVDNNVESDTANIKPHLRGIKLLDELGLIDLLLPELAELKDLSQPKKYHIFDAYWHSIKAFEVSPPHLRWAALLHDVGKRRAFELNGGVNMHGHDEIGADMVRGILGRLKFANADKARTVSLVRWHMVDVKGDMSWHKLRRFAAEHSDIADDLCVIKEVDAFASSGRRLEQNRLREAWNEIQEDGTPLSIKQLKVDGNDLKELGVEDKEIGNILSELWLDTVLNPALNDKNKAIKYVLRKVNGSFDE